MTQDKLDVLADSCWEEHNGLNTFNHVKFAALVAAHEREKQAEQEPVGYWQGKFSQDGCTVLYEVPQASAFGYHYPNYPVYAAPQPVKQEPVAWTATRLWNRKDTWKCSADIEKDLLYAAPVRTKDLTFDEIVKVLDSLPMTATHEEIIRAVIAADREKNK